MNKKLVICILIIIPFLMFAAEDANAGNFSDEEINRVYRGIFENLGGGEVLLAGEAAGISDTVITNPVELAKFFDFRSIVNFLTGNLPDIITEALLDFRILLMIVITYAIASALQGVSNLDFVKVPLNFTFVLAVALSVYSLTGSALKEAQYALMESAGFIKIGVPVLIGAEIASGRAVTSLVIPSSIAVVISLFSSFNIKYMIPLINIFFSLALASAVYPNTSLKGLCKSAKEIIIFILKLMTTVLVGVLSLQRVVAKAADTFGAEVAKFALGSFIPIVGGIITDAFGVVVTCAKTIRATVGTVGVLVIISVMLPIIVRVAMYVMIFKLTAACAGIFENGVVSDFLKSMSDMWSILMAITVCQGVYFVATLAILATG